MHRMMRFCTVTAACVACLLGTAPTPALASVNPSNFVLETASPAQARAFLQKQEIIKFTNGVKLKVNYTFNDGNGTISGITRTSLYYRPPGISNVSWTYQRVNGGESYLFTLVYFYGGDWGYQTARLWPKQPVRNTKAGPRARRGASRPCSFNPLTRRETEEHVPKN